jgi:hypothetical protein
MVLALVYGRLVYNRVDGRGGGLGSWGERVMVWGGGDFWWVFNGCYYLFCLMMVLRDRNM